MFFDILYRWIFNLRATFGLLLIFLLLFILFLEFDELEPPITSNIIEFKFRMGQKLDQPLSQITRAIRCKKIQDGVYVAGKYRWERMTRRAPWVARDGASAVRHNNAVYMIGGWSGGDEFERLTTNEVWSTIDGRSWSLVKPNTFDKTFDEKVDGFPGRHRAPVVSFKGWIYILGGDANQGTHQTDVWRSRNGVVWEKVLDAAPWAPRVLHMAVVKDNRIYVFGGQTLPFLTRDKESGNESYFNDVWQSEDGKNWQLVKQNGLRWEPRGGIGGDGFLFNNKIFIVGGFNYAKTHASRHVAYFDVWSSEDMRNWKSVTQHAEFERDDNGFLFHDVAVFDNKLWIIGGARLYRDTNEIWYSNEGRFWNQLKCSAIAPTHASTVVSMDDGILFAAGHHMNREVWKLTFNK